MNSVLPPGPLYIVSPEPRPSDWNAFVRRLAHVKSDTGEHVAFFTDANLAGEWIELHAEPGDVLKPFAFAESDELVMFLNDLKNRGDTHVGVFRSRGAFGVATIDAFIGLVRVVQRNPRPGNG